MTENKPSTFSLALRTLLALLILVAAFGVATFFIGNPAKTETKEKTEKERTLVETENIKLGTHTITIQVMGQVRAARETILKAQVSGEIKAASENFIPGGFFTAGSTILKIDPSDYELDLKMKAATLAQTYAALRLEKGQQAVAKDELKILEQSTGQKLKNTDLVLRKPQLEQARADIRAAKASHEIAELNLKRTTLNAPFNAIVTDRQVNLGNVITGQDALATLVSTDEYWVNIEVPVRDLRWITVPRTRSDTASKAIINMDGGRGTRIGYLLKSTGSLNTQSRLAELIIAVPDPLLRKQGNLKMDKRMPLVLGDFVHVDVLGTPLENTARIPKTYLRDGGTIWIARDGKLVIQEITVAYADRNYAYVIKGIQNNDRIITSNIVTPVNGMEIVLSDEAEKE